MTPIVNMEKAGRRYLMVIPAELYRWFCQYRDRENAKNGVKTPLNQFILKALHKFRAAEEQK